MPPSIQYVEDLTPTHVTLLTQLLHLPPNASITSSWLHDQHYLISTFPRTLQRPTSLLSRAILALPLHIPSRAVLCRSHRDLNPFLTRQIFLHLSAECTTKLHRLAAPSVRASLPQDLREWLRRLECLNSLWMRPELYRTVYGAMPVEPRKEWVRSGCEACVLARIGGDAQALVDLRASCLGRMRKRRRRPRLLAVIDGWMGWSGEREWVEEESESISKEVRRVRKELQEQRKEKAEHKRKKTKERNRSERDSPMARDEDQEHDTPEGHDPWNDTDTDDVRENDIEDHPDDDFENVIISHYRNLLSTASLDSQISGPLLHPTFRASLTFHPETGTFHRSDPDSISNLDGAGDARSPSPNRRHASRTSSAYGTRPYTAPRRPQAAPPNDRNHHTMYTQSQYSRASGFGATSPERARHLADAYRRLVGAPEYPGRDGRRSSEWRNCSVERRRRRGRGWGWCEAGCGDGEEEEDEGGDWVDDERWTENEDGLGWD